MRTLPPPVITETTHGVMQELQVAILLTLIPTREQAATYLDAIACGDVWLIWMGAVRNFRRVHAHHT